MHPLFFAAITSLSACAPPPLPQDTGAPRDSHPPTDSAPPDSEAQREDSDSPGDSGGETGGEGGDAGEEAEPGVQLLFPTTSKSVVICAETVVVLAMEDFETVDHHKTHKNQEGQGHWHLYDGSSFLGAFHDHWAVVELDYQSTSGEIETHILTVKLAENDHSELDAQSTVEILVGSGVCIGGDPLAGSGPD